MARGVAHGSTLAPHKLHAVRDASTRSPTRDSLQTILLATAAGYAAYRFGKISLLILTGVVLSYQVAGSLVEWAIAGNFFTAIQDFRIGIPGMLLQIFGGYIVLKLMTK